MTTATLDRQARTAKRATLTRLSIFAAALTALAAACPSARALDGCKVLLCLAAPNRHAIPACVPPIRQLFHDLAHGHAFPTCAMQGAGNTARNAWTHAPEFCPPQYTHLLGVERGPIYVCDYSGAVSVTLNGTLFSRTWWNSAGGAVTEFTPAAKAQLGAWDSQFDADFAAWQVAHPAPPVDDQP